MDNTEGAVIDTQGSPSGEPQGPSTVAEGTTTPAVADPGTGAAATEPQPYDFYNPDTWGDKDAKDVMKEIQKHVSEVSESKNTIKSELEAERQARQQLLKEAEAVLRDEGMYRAYREKLGLQPKSLETSPPQQEALNQLSMVELSPDMSITEAQDRFNRALSERDKFHAEYTKRVVNETLDMFKKEVYKELGQSLAPMHKSKWKSAMESAESVYGPEFVSVRNRLVSMIDGPYSNLYNGENESELIDKVFRAEFPDKFEKYITSKHASRAATVTNASTAGATRNTVTLPTDNSDASCIARANARVEAALRAKGLK